MNSDIYAFPFLPNAKPRNLKFRIANTLTVRLFSRLTVSFSLSSRYFVLLSKSLSDARLLFARSTMSSAYLMHGTPLSGIPGRTHWGRCLPAMVIDFHLVVSLPLCQWPLRFHYTAFQIALYQLYYTFIFTFFRRRLMRISWLRVSKYFDKSRTTANV